MRRRRFSRFAMYRRSRQTVLFAVCAVLIVLMTATLLIDAGIRPYVRSIAELQAQGIAQEIINKSVSQVLSSKGYSYDEMVTVDSDSSGKVSAIKTDAVKVNLLKSTVSERIVEDISKVKNRSVNVPLGAVTGSDFFAGRGPDVSLNLSLTGSAGSNITNEFISAGVNQTLHRMMLEIKTKVYVVLPGNTGYVEINTEFCIAETVIVGTVPDFYRSGTGNVY